MDSCDKTDETATAPHATPTPMQIADEKTRYSPVEAILETAPTEPGILLFDEADSLFGKRSTVKDSHKK